MMATWTSTTLGSICKFQAGDGFPKDLQGDVNGEYPVVKVSDMNLAGNELFIINANNWLSKQAVEKAFKLHPPGAVIFAKIGIALTSNRRRILVRPTVIDNNMMSATCSKDIDPRWFYSLLTTLDFNEVSSGSALPFLTVRDLSKITISVPPLPEQRAIAATLGALDDKIELNRKMNATLEAMARALFRDWFLDFGPTRAKMAGRAPYLSPDLWALFPDRLDDEGKPEGWELSPLEALAEVTMGISPDGSTYNDRGEGTPLCNGPVEYGDFFLRQIKWTTAPSKLAQRGDLIICVRGSTTGRHAFADSEYCLGRGVASIRGYENNQEFVETALLMQMNRLLQKTTGSVFPSLATQDIKKFALIDPGHSLRSAFATIACPMRDRIWSNAEESRTLAQTRDLLLPRLMSGELRVAEAERLASEVA